MPINTYSIQDVSVRTNVSKHTLRFWEKELNGIIIPLRTNGGQRRYTSNHLAVIEEIKRLRKNGMSLVDIKNILNRGTGKGLSIENNNLDKIDILANRIAEAVRSTLYNFLEEENSHKKP